MVDGDLEEFYRYSTQKWLWNEPAQLLRRYLQFNMDALIHVAEEATGDGSICVDVTKLPEGNSNKVFLVTMQDGKQLVVNLPNPNSGPVHYTTASEVATMQFVRGPSTLIAAVTCTLARSLSPYHGALYRRQDVSQSESFVLDDAFAIGPITGRAWFDNRRAEVEVPRGTSAENVLKALVKRETACLEKFSTFPRDTQQGIFGGPGGYHPTTEAKLSVLQDSLKICPHLFPRNEKLCTGVIWHNDLHMHNIFVDSENPSQISSIIDWQGTPIYPMFLVCHHPP
ncbi:unnamed protein product [Penicillium nalgiovense]|nr:unnamed protein product [Penicillium nalgiovense]